MHYLEMVDKFLAKIRERNIYFERALRVSETDN